MASPAYQSSGMYGTPYAGSPGGMMTRRSVRMLCVSRAKKRACGRMASAFVDPSRGTITCDCMRVFSFHVRGLFVHHPQDNLAPRVSFRSLLVGLACLGKGQHRVDDRSNASRIDQCANLHQLLAVGLYHKPGQAHIMPLSRTS